jgi:hypothetical protein
MLDVAAGGALKVVDDGAPKNGGDDGMLGVVDGGMLDIVGGGCGVAGFCREFTCAVSKAN